MYTTWNTVRGHVTTYITGQGGATDIQQVVAAVATAQGYTQDLVRHVIWHGISNNKLKFVFGWKVDNI